ncbi:Endonuclease/exonuclease/phosphatase [Schizothecium vesticola]|uniref:Endonuclease/exonuclease/phosphatase n=1 Tax=Schizothecium vesticola TaxID=314040 RepID=A0AA40F6I3_9PEZI|nr:Endonuclease/exonuclease/phosphatase [Schizothecium vesticola]
MSTQIRLVTFNIRYAAPTLAPLEEATASQLHDILAALNQPPSPTGLTWSHIGTTRCPGSFPDESNPILYPTQSFLPSRSATLWLSSTPDRPSRGWDAGLHRIVTTKSVVVMNTHLDHAGRKARVESVGLLGRVAREWDGEGVGAVFLGGDFNSRPGSEVVRRMTVGGGWREVVDLEWEERGKIDYLFVRGEKVEGVVVDRFEVLGNEAEGVLFSDHRAVVADVRVLG